MNKKTLIGIVIGVLLLGVIGFSYSFFTTSIIGTGQENTVTAGTLELQYIDGPGVSLSKAYPGQSITKVVSVKNIGTLDTEYDLIFKDLVNEILYDELEFSYTCTSYKNYVDTSNKGTVSGTCKKLSNNVVPASATATDSTISTNISIASTITHEYTFTFTFKEINSGQNYNQGKHFSTKINVTESEKTGEDSRTVLIANSDFVYGSNYDLTKTDSTNNEMLTSGAYGLGKTSDVTLTPQDITIKVTNTDVSNYTYNVTLGYFDADGNYTGRSGILPMTEGELTIKASEISGAYFKVSVYIYSPFTKIPETATIVVYSDEKEEEEIETEVDRSALISNNQFVYGSYFDLNNSNNPNEDKNAKRTDGAYGLIKTSDVLLPAQDILIKVTDTDLSDYKVTLGYFDADGNYKGRNQILSMTDGELEIKASEIGSAYFRVNVYKMPSGFTKVPETAKIVVYGGSELPNTEWGGKNITIVGDSISTGGWTSTLGNMTSANITNLSQSGITLTSGIVSKVQEMSGEADLIIIFGGTNDYWHKGTNIGTINDATNSTYYGALNTILNTLRTNYSDTEYLFVFPYDQTFGGNASSTDFGKGSLDDFRTAFINFCTTNNLNNIDLGTTNFDSAEHTSDGVHPNSAGHQIIANAIYKYITTY